MGWTQAEGGTFEEALGVILTALGADRSEVEIENMGEYRKLLGLGRKVTRVRGRLKKEAFYECTQAEAEPLNMEEKIRLHLEDVLCKMGIAGASVKVAPHGDGVTLEVVSNSGGLIIGRNGETLNALQTLMQIYFCRMKKAQVEVIVDTENYRSRRKQKLVDMARKSAKEALKKGRGVRLAPMTVPERRIIHALLKDDPEVETRSEGEGSGRRVVIFPLLRS